MSNEKYTNGVAVDIIANEGIGYAVLHYIDGDAFKDPETVKKWNAAETALNDLRSYLTKETGRDDI
jgi:hypothetical protein